MSAPFLYHPLLAERGVHHGFGLRGSPEPPGLVRPRQVHGAAVARPHPGGGAVPARADVIVSDAPGVAVAVVTADCVPILLAAEGGRVVAAVHAGWRGLARGVVGAGVAAVQETAGSRARLVAALGPHIGPCCYEVDEPVVEALREGLGAPVDDALRPARAGRTWLDLARLVRGELARAGLPEAAVGGFAASCTRCDPERFHSYRRDGRGAGRMVHFVAARGAAEGS